MNSSDLLKEVIDDFSIEKLERFFRAKNRSFRPRAEGLAQHCDTNFKSCQKLGEFHLDGGDIAICAFEVARPLSERTGKRSQYSVGKRIIQQLQCSAGLFVFYDDKGDFRFSLIYDIPQGRSRTWSNFRRYTYFASRTLTNRTLLQRVGNGDFSALEKIKAAFSVEKVTEEFYQQYRALFDVLLENLQKNHTFQNEAEKHHLDTADFTKKLLGQIVFLYFIQKKGWLGVPRDGKWGDGDKDFLSNQFRRAVEAKLNYFNDVLEPLFYATLNNARRDTTDPSYSEQFQSRIPFLNGGLFESEYDWKESLIYLDNAIFERIFDTFDRYNFTVEEEGPDDKEIAVDPEMLGKVFENLLPENLRKGKGTYYTPRNIVQYMCRESLIEYLISRHSNISEREVRDYIFYAESTENFLEQKGGSFVPGQYKELDDLLASVKIVDPACGSGAFLVGTLNEIVRLRLFLQDSPDNKSIARKSEYQLKKETIQNCVYGVDIDPGAVDIAKLRLWLSLIVDHELNQVEPLPNLDYKIMAGNSLLEEYEGVSFYEDEVETGQSELLTDPTRTSRKGRIEDLKKKLAEYFSIHDDEAKRTKRAEINVAKDWLIRSALEKKQREIGAMLESEKEKADMLDERSRGKYLATFGAWMMSDTKIQEALDSIHNPKRAKPFFAWRLEFIDVFDGRSGFDVVIANPPYIRQEEISYKHLLKQYAVAGGTADIYCYFYELVYNILGDGGTLSFITSNKYLRAGYGKKLRQFLKQHMSLKTPIDFGDLPVFKATAYPSILIAKKQHGVGGLFSGCAIESEDELDQFRQVLEQRCITMRQDELSDEDGWNIETPDTAALKRKIEGTPQNTRMLKDYVGGKILYGIKTGYNDAFVIDTATRDRLIKEDPKSAEVIKPFLRGQDIKRYWIEDSGLFLIDIPNGWTDKRKGNEGAEAFIRGHLPAIFAHLSQYRKKVNPKGGRTLENRDDQGRYWWELRPCKYEQEFEKPKITWGNLSKAPGFAYDEASRYISAPASIVAVDDLYLLGVLNSGICRFIISSSAASRSGGFLEFMPMYVERVPIRLSSNEHRKAIEQRVHQILAAKKRDSDTTALEREIDQLVYEVYGLTKVEIELLEASIV